MRDHLLFYLSNFSYRFRFFYCVRLIYSSSGSGVDPLSKNPAPPHSWNSLYIRYPGIYIETL